MTRTTRFSALSCAALLAAVMGAWGCGSNSTINSNSAGGRTGSLGGSGGGAVIITGAGGRAGGNMDAGVMNMCMVNAACNAGFICDTPCNVGGNAGTRPCTCGANGRLACPGGNGTCNVVDAGFNMCVNATPCTAGFTCNQMCAIGGVMGMRACTCDATGMVACPAGNAGCTIPPGSLNMCMNGAPCSAAFTCNAACMVGNVAGTRPCTCGANGTLNCPGGNGTCAVPDAGLNMCVNGDPCSTGFTCTTACMVGNVAGTRACTCGANNTLNCPAGNGTCIVPDAGLNMCVNGDPCSTGFTCRAACMVGNVAGTRACTCGANNTLNCPGGNATCILPDAGAPPPADAAADAPRG